MALIQCPDCAQNVSDQAALCRHCGRPIKGSVHVGAVKDEVELELFTPQEVKQMRTQVLNNEGSLMTQFRAEAKAELKKKKKRQERMSLIKTILIIIVAGVLSYVVKKML